MWLELLPILVDKFEALKAQRQPEHDPLREAVLRRYEAYSLDMLDGMRTLLFNLIESQNYLRKRVPTLELHLYIDMHRGIMTHIEETGRADIPSIPALYYELLHLTDLLCGYCVLLRQDMFAGFQRYPRLHRDRRFRQGYLIVKQAIEAIRRHREKADALSRLIGASTSAQAAQIQPPATQDEWIALMQAAGLSESDQKILLSKP